MRAEVIRLDRDWWKEDRKASTCVPIVARPRKISNKYYSVKNVAERFSVGISLIYDLIYSKALDAEMLGRTYRISHEALEDYLERSRNKRV